MTRKPSFRSTWACRVSAPGIIALVLVLSQFGPTQPAQAASSGRPLAWPPGAPAPVLSGYSIVALNPDPCYADQNGAIFGGAMTLNVVGSGDPYSSGIYTNGCLSGTSSYYEVNMDWGADGVYYAGETSGPMNFEPFPPLQVFEQIEPYTTALDDLLQQRCSMLPIYGSYSGSGTISPAVYDAISISSHDALTMQPGLYCVRERFSAIAEGILTADGVTLYMMETNTDFTITGAPNLSMSAPRPGVGDDTGLVDLLLYVNSGNPNTVDITGGSTSSFKGTIYAPAGTISITDNYTTATYQAQFIGWNVKIFSYSDVAIVYSGSFFDPGIDLQVRKQALSSTVLPGEMLSYRLEVENSGTLSATQVTVHDLIPPELTNLSVDSTLTLTPTGGADFTWELPTLMPGAYGVITVTGQVVAPLPAGSYFINHAEITTTAPLTIYNPSNDWAEAYVSVLNAAPVAISESYTATMNIPLSVNAPGVLDNDSELNGDPLLALLQSAPEHGTLVLNTNGSFVYTPTLNYSGPDAFTYRAIDGWLSSDISAVNLTIVNHAPLAADDDGPGFVTNEDTPIALADVLANDVDADGHALFVDSFDTGATLGLVTFGPTGPAGALDPRFDDDGWLATDFFSNDSDDADYALILQPDGKLVTAGYFYNGSDNDFALARYNSNGSLDTSFDGDGRVSTDFFGGSERVYALALQPDGKIVAAGDGEWGGSSEGFVLARYNPDGSLDTSFADDGILTSDFDGYARALVVQPDGKIIAAGHVFNGSDYDFGLARYNPNGSPDYNFNEDGLVIINSGSSDGINALVLQPDGKIVAAGFSVAGFGNADFALARYNPDGSLDASFDEDGWVTTDFFGSSDWVFDLVLQPDGKLVAAGPIHTGVTPTSALVRYNPDGSLDTSFGEDGWLITDFFGGYESVYTLALQPDGKFVAAGSDSNDFTLVRYNPDGSLDTSFGDSGLVNTDFFGFDDFVTALILQPDGKLVAAGNTINNGYYYFAMARYEGGGNRFIYDPNGQFDWLAPSGVATDTFTYVVSDGVLFDTATVSITILGVNNMPIANDDSGMGFITDEDTPFTLADVLVNDVDDDLLFVDSFDISDTLGLVTFTQWVLDSSFDGDGKAITAFFNVENVAYAVALQPDGKIIVAGIARSDSDTDFALARYNPDGSLDSSFDGDGKLTTDFFGSQDTAYAMVLQPDGKVIAAGFAINGGKGNIALARYNPDGSLDLSFDGDGKLTTDYFGNGMSANAITLQPDGKIIVAGSVVNGSDNDFALVRYNPDGSVDTSFDGDGLVTTNFTGSEWVNDLMLQPDGKLVVAGTTWNGSNYDSALARYNPDGSLDTSFNGDGQVVTDFFGNNNSAYTLARQPDGKIITAGYVGNDFALVRYNEDGSLDLSFDGDGLVTNDFSGGGAALAVILQPDDKIVAGTVYNSSDFALARYNPDGSLDTSFNGDGLVTTDLRGYEDTVYALALQPDGKLIAAGDAGRSDGRDFGLARYASDGSILDYDPNGQFDWLAAGEVTTDTFFYIVSDGVLTDTATVSITIVGVNDGVVANHDFGPGFITNEDTPIALADVLANDVDADGHALFIDSLDTSATLGLVNFVPPSQAGVLDSGFNGDGKVITDFFGSSDDAHALALQPDGKLVVAGYAENDGNADFALARYNPDGSLDPGFGGDGRVVTDFFGSFDNATALIVQPDGKLIAAGYAQSGSNNDFALARYNPDGSLDTSFDDDGKLTTDYFGNNMSANAMTLQPDGKIIVAGSAWNGSDNDFALVRYNPDGSLDTSFDEDGRLTTNFFGSSNGAYALALQPDGKIVAVGYALNGSSYDSVLVRYNPDGSLDADFDDDGWVTTDFFGGDDAGTALALQSDGKLVVVGQAYNGSNNDFSLARYNPDGSLDTSFNDDGWVTTDFFGNNDFATDLVLQSDGKFITAGRVYNSGNFNFALVRYNPDGSLDASFDDDGKLTTDISSGEDYANALVLQPDGKIIVAGYAENGGTGDFALARYEGDGNRCMYDPNGQFDWLLPGEEATDTFTYIVSDGALTDMATVSIAIQGVNDAPVLEPIGEQFGDELTQISFYASASDVDDPAYVLTFSLDPGAPDGASIDPASGLFTWTPTEMQGPGVYTIIVRVADDGSPALDDSEVITITVGEVNLPPVANDDSGSDFMTNADTSFYLADVLANDVDADGNTLFVDSFDASATAGLVTFLPDPAGALDLSFDGDGRVVTDFPGSYLNAYALALQPDGKLIVAGITNDATTTFALARYNPDGSLDTSFGGDGLVTADFCGGAQALVLQLDGKVIAAGSACTGGSSADFALVRYHPDGSLDASFGADGLVTTDFFGGLDEVYALALQPDGTIVAAGYAANGSNWDFALARYNPNGSLDTGFGIDGLVTTDFLGSYDYAYTLVLQPDGKLVAAGGGSNADSTDFALARYSPDGSLDAGFGVGGLVVTDLSGTYAVVSGLALQFDGKFVVSGTTHNGSNYDFALARYNPDGSLDTSFDGDGLVTTDLFGEHDEAYALVIQPDNKLVVAGDTWNNGNIDFGLARYNPDGSLDTSFDGDGLVTTDFYGSADWGTALALEPGGRLVVAGYVNNYGDDSFALARYEGEGGTFYYDPNSQFDWLAPGEVATDTFTYVISDGLVTDTAVVNITIVGVNDAPQFDPIGEQAGDELTLISFTASASDAEIDTLVFWLDPGAPDGAAIDAASGLFTWTPTELQGPGVYTVTVRVADEELLNDSETITITVNEANLAPTAASDSYVADEDVALIVNAPGVLANDSDADLPAQVLSAVLQSGPAHGVLTLNADGSFSYTPGLDYHGSDGFTYLAHDGVVGSSLTTVNLTIDSVNDAPVAGDQTVITEEDTRYTGALSASDVDGDSLSFSPDTAAAHGTLEIAADGIFTYTPDLNYNGTDSFAFAVSDGALGDLGLVNITITPVNDVPAVEAGADQAVGEGTPVNFAGSYADPGLLAFQAVEIAWNFGDGTTITGTLSVTHTYADDGAYTATLTINDGQGGIGSDSLLVTVANVAPALTPLPDQNLDMGAPLVLSGTFSDPGWLDAHQVTLIWGDGMSLTQNLAMGAYNFSAAHTFDAAGSYLSTVVVADEDGGTDTQSVVVTVVDAPISGLNFVSTSPDMLGQTTVLTASVASGSDITWAWDFGDDTTGSGPNVSHAYAMFGEYVVTLTATNGSGSEMAVGLVVINDPTLLPIELNAEAGYANIELGWNPTNDPQVVAYRVLRSIGGPLPMSEITVTADTFYFDADPALVPGTLYCYQVKALHEHADEVLISNTDCAVFGQAELWVPDVWARPDEIAIVPINIRNADGLQIAATDIWLDFDGQVLEPLVVSSTALTEGYLWTYSITGTETISQVHVSAIVGDPTVIYGDGSLFWLVVRVKGTEGMTSTLNLVDYVDGVGGTTIYTPEDLYHPIPLVLQSGSLTVAGGYILGDLNGNGVVEAVDAYIALRIATDQLEPTNEQRYAGDINGNGIVEAADATMILYYAAHGYWPAPGMMKQIAEMNGDNPTIILDNARGVPGSIVEVVLRAENLTNLAGADIIIAYDHHLIEDVVDVDTTGLAQGFASAYVDSGNGLLHIALASSVPVSGDGPIAILHLRIAPDAPIGSAAVLALSEVSLNDIYGRDYATSALQLTSTRVNGAVSFNYYYMHIPLILKRDHVP